jgi:hypothetical protein
MHIRCIKVKALDVEMQLCIFSTPTRDEGEWSIVHPVFTSREREMWWWTKKMPAPAKN